MRPAQPRVNSIQTDDVKPLTEIHPPKGCDMGGGGGRLGAMTLLGMISYQGPAGACDGWAQVTLGYRSRAQLD